MFGSQILEVGVGLVLVFLIFSVMLTSAQELIENRLKTRAVEFERGIRQLLHDTEGRGLVKEFYHHPLIYPMFRDAFPDPDLKHSQRRNLPSYMPAASFALAVLDLERTGKITSVDHPEVYSVVQQAKAAVGDEADRVRKYLEFWFDSAMERVSGSYKRSTQVRVFVLAIALSIGLNVNTLTIAESLTQDDALRQTVVAHAEAQARAATPDTQAETFASLKARYGEIENLGLPIGWTERNREHVMAAFRCPGGGVCVGAVASGLSLMVGWLLTAIAISLGAPFWFDVLNKFMVLRATTKPFEKTPPEASEDRQLRNANSAAK
ncbi:hypothetical protein [Phenylobacterium sp.]|uniref:hypothetical protein n=1 Tax=Phenylobacterium sp. TaxID=1871053 RepID=UPI0025F23A80|nr:hypothetical protein [Phenylobacterium sp.]